MNEDSMLLSVSEADKFITNYKAVYQAMTAKHDCKSKIFARNVKVTLDDIYDLNNRVAEKLLNYKDAGFSISVNVSFVGRKTIEFSSWTEFERHNWNESYAINSITIIWEFNAIMPKYPVPQKHLLVVKIADGLRPEEMINIVFAGKLENIDEIERQIYPVVARVDFINSLLGDELLNIVEEWNNCLETQDDEGHTIQVLRKHRRKLAYLLNYVTKIVTFVCCIRIIIYMLMGFQVSKLSDLKVNDFCDLLWVVCGLIFSYIFVDKISEWVANVFFRTLGDEKERHVFAVNKGDRNVQNDLERKYKQSKMITFGSVVGTFLINLGCSIVCALIV